MRNRRYEQGGVVSFVIVAVVLAALLGTGIWWAKRSQTVVSNTQETVTAPGVSDTTNNDSEAPQTDENSGTSSGSTEESQNSSTTPSTGPSGSGSSSGASSSTTDSVASTGPSAAEIPSTGPSDVLAVGFAVSAAGAGSYYFLQSRSRVRSSALK